MIGSYFRMDAVGTIPLHFIIQPTQQSRTGVQRKQKVFFLLSFAPHSYTFPFNFSCSISRQSRSSDLVSSGREGEDVEKENGKACHKNCNYNKNNTTTSSSSRSESEWKCFLFLVSASRKKYNNGWMYVLILFSLLVYLCNSVLEKASFSCYYFSCNIFIWTWKFPFTFGFLPSSFLA